MNNNLVNNEKGSVIIIVVLLMTVLMGCAALVLDVGRVYIEESKLQNAIDAASLAAAQDLPDAAKAADSANHYIVLNGYTPADISINFSNSNMRIDISGSKVITYSFAKVLGFDSTTVNRSASAERKSIGPAFDYTLFSGSITDTLSLNGSNFYIGGSTHTNYKFNMNGSSQTITGACEAVSSININGSNINVNNRMPGAPFVEMPDFSEIIRIKAENAGQSYVGNQNFNGSFFDIDSPIYVDGNVTINGSHFMGKGCILATGNISFNGSNLNASSSDAVCFYSKNGNITVNGSNAMIDGIVFAPKGKITMNGSNQTIHGRVIGNEVGFNGSNISIIGGTSELLSLPSSSVKLTK